MKISSKETDRDRIDDPRLSAGVQVPLLLLVAFIAGLAGGAIWFSRGGKDTDQTAEAAPTGDTLASGTKAVLRNLKEPVSIRYYSLLDPASATEPIQAFAQRVQELLSSFQQVAGEKVRATRIESLSESNAAAAFADGIRPFNVDKGEGCYLGITITGQGQKEVFAQLSPDWERALEPDLARAIARVSEPKRVAASPAVEVPPDPAVLQELRAAIPNLPDVSAEEGKRILQEKAMTAFAAAAAELQTHKQAAQERFAQAQAANSEADQQVATEELKKIHTEQAEKLKEITARLQSQVETLERIKRK